MKINEVKECEWCGDSEGWMLDHVPVPDMAIEYDCCSWSCTAKFVISKMQDIEKIMDRRLLKEGKESHDHAYS